ncbi:MULTISPECIES: hypothetical protein [Enterococcus]|uniref:Uncharacterized protein n=1 Tax=Enterococcus alishanensis TaxID=1303817 RepID=A0ABS6TH25_9ENTE|nr:hypothetical protein [Enterococcus alishanensis]MBV7392251.1 hypothetical protein [Enterococcus alishanensis]
MQNFYVLFSFICTFGIILMIITFFKDYKRLTVLQKASLILISIGGLAPMILGTIQGFLAH